MNGVLDGIGRDIVESKDGEIKAINPEYQIDCSSEYQVRMKPTVPKHRLFISCPTKGRTEESIKKSFEVLKRTAEAYIGKSLQVINPYEQKTFKSDADRIRSMGDSIKLIADADYFITVDRFWEHTECGVENNIAGECGVKRMLAMTEFAAPDVIEKSKNLVRNPYYNE